MEPIDYNIECANELSVSIKWIEKHSEAALPDLNLAILSNVHSITLITLHLSLYDDFHKDKQNKRKSC